MRLQLDRRARLSYGPNPAHGCSVFLLAALLAIGLAVTSPARADGESAALISVYTDSDDLTVVSPQARVEQAVTEELSATVAYDADIITAATVDVRTAASPRGYDEVRHGLLASASWTPAVETTLSLRYLPSFEPDYRSHGVGSDVSHEWWDRRLSTRLSFVMRHNRVGRSGEPSERWRSLATGIAGLEQGIVVDRYTLATVAYELQLSRGFMASPYRFASVRWPDGTIVRVPEQNPEHRTRHAARAGLRRRLASRVFAAGGYRFYADDWGVRSHTTDAELQVELVHHTLIGALAARGYHQTAASFYQPRYRAPFGRLPQRRTGDKLLAESWSLLGELRLEASLELNGFVDVLRGMFGLAVYAQHFIDFAALNARRAFIASFGVTAEY
jgi:Protein of unknown function (DUF3570)